MKTALQELIEWMGEQDSKRILLTDFAIIDKVTELLEKEKEKAQEYARFAVECDRRGMPILEFQDWIKL